MNWSLLYWADALHIHKHIRSIPLKNLTSRRFTRYETLVTRCNNRNIVWIAHTLKLTETLILQEKRVDNWLPTHISFYIDIIATTKMSTCFSASLWTTSTTAALKHGPCLISQITELPATHTFHNRKSRATSGNLHLQSSTAVTHCLLVANLLHISPIPKW